MIGDPDQLDGLATQLRAHAEEVRVVAGDHVRAGQAAHWVSAAGQEYRDRIWDDRTAAHAAADEMDTAAGLINAHADAVRERLAAIAAAAAALEAAREAADAVDESTDPSLTAFLDDAHVFFDSGGGTTVAVQAFEIDRGP